MFLDEMRQFVPAILSSQKMNSKHYPHCYQVNITICPILHDKIPAIKEIPTSVSCTLCLVLITVTVKHADICTD